MFLYNQLWIELLYNIRWSVIQTKLWDLITVGGFHRWFVAVSHNQFNIDWMKSYHCHFMKRSNCRSIRVSFNIYKKMGFLICIKLILLSNVISMTPISSHCLDQLAKSKQLCHQVKSNPNSTIFEFIDCIKANLQVTL